MKKRGNKIIHGIPPEFIVPIGGYAMSFVNKYTKMAAYDTWNYIRKRGRYQLYECDDLNVIQTDILKKKIFGIYGQNIIDGI